MNRVRRTDRREEESSLIEKTIAVNRVAGATGIALGAAALGCGVAAVVTTPW